MCTFQCSFSVKPVLALLSRDFFFHLLWGGRDGTARPYLIHGSTDPQIHMRQPQQTASRSVLLFLQGSQTRPTTDRQTDTQTDHATPSVAIGRI